MLSSSQLLILIALATRSCQALKLSPAEWLLKSSVQKRQQKRSSSSPSTTTITTNFGMSANTANTCVCRLVSPYTPFVTITSTYTATNSNDGTSTTTIAQQSGSIPGTVEILSPVSFVTTTSYYDETTSFTTTIAQPSGTNPGTVLVELPGQYVTVTTYDSSFLSTATTTASTYTGGTQPGTVIVNAPASYTTITTYADVSSVTTFTSATYTGGSAPGTIVVESPGVYVTTYDYNLSPGAPSSTTTLSTYTGGNVPGTIEIFGPGIYTTKTSYYGQSTAATSTAVTYTGPSGSTTNTGTIVVLLPASEAPVATSPPASIISQYTGTSDTASQTVPSGQATASANGAPDSCNNQGLEWAEYPNVSGDWSRPGPNNDPPGYTSFQVEPYKMKQPQYQGIVSNIAGFSYEPTSQGTITIYDSATIPSDYWVLNHQGYIFAPESGIYNFTSYIADDIVLVWVGSLAYSGWKRSNAGLEQVYNDPPQGFVGYPGEPPVSFTVELQAGSYYPFRILYANAQRQAQFHIIITAPDGTEFLGPDTNGSPFIVRYSCDEVTAPRFPAFGNQS